MRTTTASICDTQGLGLGARGRGEKQCSDNAADTATSVNNATVHLVFSKRVMAMPPVGCRAPTIPSHRRWRGPGDRIKHRSIGELSMAIKYGRPIEPRVRVVPVDAKDRAEDRAEDNDGA